MCCFLLIWICTEHLTFQLLLLLRSTSSWRRFRWYHRWHHIITLLYGSTRFSLSEQTRFMIYNFKPFRNYLGEHLQNHAKTSATYWTMQKQNISISKLMRKHKKLYWCCAQIITDDQWMNKWIPSLSYATMLIRWCITAYFSNQNRVDVFHSVNTKLMNTDRNTTNIFTHISYNLFSC